MFDDDNRGEPFVRPAVTIHLTDRATGAELETIELPELVIPHDQLSPEWLAACEREKNESAAPDAAQIGATMNEPNDDETTEPRVGPAAQEPELKPWGLFDWGDDVRATPESSEEAAK